MTESTTRLSLAAGAAIDLHLHTIYSDGTWTPEALLDHLVENQFSLAAIADHDRTDKVAEIQQLALEKHLPVLAAVEMSCTWKDEMVDLLCYGFDPGPSALADLAQEIFYRQQENTRAVFATLLQQGYALPEDKLDIVLATPSPEQPHALLDLLKEHGYGLGDPPAGRILGLAGCTYAMNEPAAVVEAAQRSGAACLLAHPGHGDGFVDFDIQLLDQFRQEAPVDGVEVYHPIHTPAKTELYREYARKNGLLTSAGSDSHKPDKPPIQYRAELCRDLLERVGIRVW